MLKKSKIILFVCLLTAVGLGIFTEDRYVQKLRTHDLNVILITIDALRPDHLGCYGYKRDTSPHIDKQAIKSTLFMNAITPQPKTTPAMVSVLSGQYPHTHGVRDLHQRLDPKIPLLQEILLNTGYTTAAFVGNWVLKKNFSGLDRGFETYYDITPDKELNRNIYETKAPDLNRVIEEWLKNNFSKKFFLWVHYQDVHGPYIAPPEYRDLFRSTEADRVRIEFMPEYQILPRNQGNPFLDANEYRDAYDAEIRFVDDYVGRLLGTLEALGLMGRTMIIITADHGESLGEHSYYFRHGTSVYDDTSKVPLLIYLPAHNREKNIKRQVNIMDIAPTVLDVLGLAIPPDMEGRSLLPAIQKGRRGYPDIPIFIEGYNALKIGMRTNRWKYIINTVSGSEHLFNLQEDPREIYNVINDQKRKASELKAALNAWTAAADHAAVEELDRKKLAEEDVRALKSLGYLQ